MDLILNLKIILGSCERNTQKSQWRSQTKLEQSSERGSSSRWAFRKKLMSGSCHLDRASNVKIGVECQIFVIVIFFNCGRVLQFGAHSRYYKGALTQKRSFLLICTTFRSAFHVGWKKPKTFNAKFLIQCSVQMTWTRH